MDWIVVADSARARIFEAHKKSRAVSEIAGLINPNSRLPERELVSDRGGAYVRSRWARSPRTFKARVAT